MVCPKCGTDLICFYVKGKSKKTIVLKLKCPKHGTFVQKIDKDLDQLHLLKASIFRCYKCGQEAELAKKNAEGPWFLLKFKCQKHKFTPSYYVWSSLYPYITSGPSTQITEPEIQKPAQSTPREYTSCVSCGYKIEIQEGESTTCPACGTPQMEKTPTKMDLQSIDIKPIDFSKPKIDKTTPKNIDLPTIEIPKIELEPIAGDDSMTTSESQASFHEEMKPTQEEKSFCSVCGARIESDMKFCIQCGSKLKP